MSNSKGTLDRIGNTFKDSTIFITGGTGFIGKALVEKLLRSTDVKKLYILIRPKKGKFPNERIQDMFANVVSTFLRISIYSYCIS